MTYQISKTRMKFEQGTFGFYSYIINVLTILPTMMVPLLLCHYYYDYLAGCCWGETKGVVATMEERFHDVVVSLSVPARAMLSHHDGDR